MLVKKLSITTSQKLQYLNMTVWCRQCSKDVSYVPSDEQCWSTVEVQYGANSVLKTSPTSVQTNNVGVLQGANSRHQQLVDTLKKLLRFIVINV